MALCRDLNFDEEEIGKVAIVVNELASNLLKHAQSGELIVSAMQPGQSARLELLALDQGPGIADVVLALRDGYSSSDTAGEGLGAVIRLSTAFDIYTQAIKGRQ